MYNFELLRNVTIGQYIPTGSVVHRLDPRAKILAAGFLTVAISFNVSVIANLLFLLVVMGIAWLARIPFSYIWRGLLLGLPVLVFIFVMQLLFLGSVEPAGAVYFEWGWLRVTRYSLHLIAISLLRIIAFIFLTSLVTMTATTTELTHGVEHLLAPFRRLGAPSHELALILTITLRFVPTLAEELERIMKAQASRGGDVNASIWRPDKMLRTVLPLIVPLFLGAFRRAEDLVLAMEARGYVSGGARTRFVELRARPLDYVVVGGALLFMLVMIWFPFPALRDVLAPLGIRGL
ncbi:MAG TPA: energy-coupling factor transporter transmembrane component T [Caldilineaceae bacterium]|nr:energy-coupling factor transporter transmembrane component T [Caldilineaceae bacterium]